MNDRFDIVALGELLIDFTMKSKDADGYPTMAANPGGAPANFLTACTRLGARTAFIGKVGDDAFGRLLKNTLERENIDSSGLLLDKDVFTTLAFVTLDENGEREFSFSRKPGADTQLRFEELDLSIIDRASAFHFGTLSLTDEPSRSATIRAAEYARSAGKLVTFDPNLRKPLWNDLKRARDSILWGISNADIVKISDYEVDFLWGISPEAGAEKIISDFGVKLVFVTCGADGCFYSNGRASGHVPALGGIKAVDTTGAGDIFGGTAIWSVIKSGARPDELDDNALRGIASLACTAAGISTTRCGSLSSAPTAEELEVFFKA